MQRKALAGTNLVCFLTLFLAVLFHSAQLVDLLGMNLMRNSNQRDSRTESFGLFKLSVASSTKLDDFIR